MEEFASEIKIIQRYFNDDPGTAAHNVEELQAEQAAKLFEKLSPATASKVFSQLTPAFAAEILSRLPLSVAQEILKRGGADLAASLLLSLSGDEKQNFVNSLPDEIKATAQEILTFPADSAGSHMKTDFAALRPHLTVNEAIKKLRSNTSKRKPRTNIYITNEENTLIGVIGIRDLLLAEPSAKLEDLMTKEVISVEPFTEIEEVSKELTRHRFLSIPVVDAQNHLIGVVRAPSLLEAAEEQATQDIQKLFGVSQEERAFSPISFCLKKRLPWLHINLITAFLAAAVVALFEDIIAQITVLAVFLPVVAGQGGNAGAQSLAVVMRGIILREIPPQDVKRLISKELIIGTINGLVVGLVTSVIAWLWHGNAYLGLVIGLAMIVNLAAAGLAGAAIPITMKRMGLDPAQSSSIILTTVTDVIGFFAFLSFAVLFKGFLL